MGNDAGIQTSRSTAPATQPASARTLSFPEALKDPIIPAPDKKPFKPKEIDFVPSKDRPLQVLVVDNFDINSDGALDLDNDNTADISHGETVARHLMKDERIAVSAEDISEKDARFRDFLDPQRNSPSAFHGFVTSAVHPVSIKDLAHFSGVTGLTPQNVYARKDEIRQGLHKHLYAEIGKADDKIYELKSKLRKDPDNNAHQAELVRLEKLRDTGSLIFSQELAIKRISDWGNAGVLCHIAGCNQNHGANMVNLFGLAEHSVVVGQIDPATKKPMAGTIADKWAKGNYEVELVQDSQGRIAIDFTGDKKPDVPASYASSPAQLGRTPIDYSGASYAAPSSLPDDLLRIYCSKRS